MSTEDGAKRGGVPAVEIMSQRMTAVKAMLEEAWHEARALQAMYYDEKHKPVAFEAGTLVLLDGKNIRTTRPSRKLAYARLGPFKVLERVGRQAYKLELPDNYSLIHNVFHVSLLTAYQCRPGALSDWVPNEQLAMDEVFNVEYIVDAKKGKDPHDNDAVKWLYLVHWLETPTAQDCWITRDEFGDGGKMVDDYHQAQARRNPRKRGRRHARY